MQLMDFETSSKNQLTAQLVWARACGPCALAQAVLLVFDSKLVPQWMSCVWKSANLERVKFRAGGREDLERVKFSTFGCSLDGQPVPPPGEARETRKRACKRTTCVDVLQLLYVTDHMEYTKN